LKTAIFVNIAPIKENKHDGGVKIVADVSFEIFHFRSQIAPSALLCNGRKFV
jgi:hypothetical protein